MVKAETQGAGASRAELASGQALRKLESRAKSLAAEMDAFAYSVSHDLKAPLRAVLGFSEALEYEFGSGLPGPAKEYLERVRNAAGRMNVLLDQLLRFSRCTRQEPAFQHVPLSALAEEIAQKAQESLGWKATWTIQPELIAETDPRYIRAIIEALFNNALKFTSRRPNPTVEFGCLTADEERHFFVKDNGAGFDPELADKMFAPFQRMHSAEEFPGEGMGLAMAHRMIGRLGGRMWAESSKDGGATFYFSLGD